MQVCVHRQGSVDLTDPFARRPAAQQHRLRFEPMLDRELQGPVAFAGGLERQGWGVKIHGASETLSPFAKMHVKYKTRIPKVLQFTAGGGTLFLL